MILDMLTILVVFIIYDYVLEDAVLKEDTKGYGLYLYSITVIIIILTIILIR